MTINNLQKNEIILHLLQELSNTKGTGLSYYTAKNIKLLSAFIEEQREHIKQLHLRFCNKDENGNPILYRTTIIGEGTPEQFLALEKDADGNLVVASENEPYTSPFVDPAKPENIEFFDLKRQIEKEDFTGFYKVSIKEQVEKYPDFFKNIDGINLTLLLDTFFIDDLV